MPLDTGVFDKIKTFQDYQKADQEFQLKKALALQKRPSSARQCRERTAPTFSMAETRPTLKVGRR
jgi:hypothetical protein